MQLCTYSKYRDKSIIKFLANRGYFSVHLKNGVGRVKKLSYEILLFLSICLLWSWRVSNSPYEKVNSAISDIWKLQNGIFVYEDISHRSGDGEQELLWGSRQEGRFQLAADGEWDWYYTGTSNTQEPVWASRINGIYLDNLSDMPENSSGDIPEYTVRLGSPELAA